MEKVRKIVPGCVLILLGILTFMYFADLKEVWFCDEIYSYESANSVEQSWPAETIGVWMSGKDVESFLAADSDKFHLQYIMDVIYGDHVPLYFFLFRILGVVFFRGSATIWIGLSINLIFYLIVLIIGYLFSCRITGSSKIAFVLMLINAVINRLMVSQMTMLRMYMMLLCAEVFLLLGALWILRESKGKLKLWPFLYLYAVSIFGFLIHYDFWVFYAVTATVFCGWMYRWRHISINKEKRVCKSNRTLFICGSYTDLSDSGMFYFAGGERRTLFMGKLFPVLVLCELRSLFNHSVDHVFSGKRINMQNSNDSSRSRYFTWRILCDR